MIRHALAESWPYLALLALAVVGLALFARDPKADQHDLTDYHEPAPVNTAPRSLSAWVLIDRQTGEVFLTKQHPLKATEPDDILPPAPAGMDAGAPLWRELTVATAVPTLSDDEVREKADAILRELGEQARAELELAR